MTLINPNEEMIILRLLAAVALVLLLGIQRERKKVVEKKSGFAGMRTHAMVAAGSALITAIGAIAFPSDPLRLAASILTGIGFIGAGTIIANAEKIRGLANAATIWVVAAIGIACGLGFYISSLIATLAIIIILELKRFEKIG